MIWHKLTKKSLPPVQNSKYFLLWRGIYEDGGFPVLAKRVQFGDQRDAHIWRITINGAKLLEEEDYSGCMWAEIEPPEEAKAAREKWENKCVWRERGREEGNAESGESLHRERN